MQYFRKGFGLCMVEKKLLNLLTITPLIFVIFSIVMSIEITDTDSLAYHLYYAKVINDQHLGFFSARPIQLDNTLGFGLSAYYPWLYSHIIAFLNRVSNFSYDNSTYLFSGILYLSIISFFELEKRLAVSFFLMIPMVYDHLFLHGANYFLTISLSFFFYKSLVIVDKKISVILMLMVGFLLINTHVFGIVFISLLMLYYFLQDRKFYILFIYILLLSYYLANNYLLTGSITFPFAQNFFPHKNFNQAEWSVITSHLHRAIFWEGVNVGLAKMVTYILLVLSVLIFSFSKAQFNKCDKFLLLMLSIPSSMFFFLGFRHRVLFLGVFVLVFIDLLQKYNINISEDLKLIFLKIRKNFTVILLGLFFFGFLTNQIQLRSKKIGSMYYVKKCFYSKISDLSINNKILFSELELMRIENPKNILSVDGKNYSEIKKLNDSIEFLKYLKKNNIKYLTVTPLVSPDVKWAEDNPFYGYIGSLVQSGDIKVISDCVAENHIDNKHLPAYLDESSRDWLIYEVN